MPAELLAAVRAELERRREMGKRATARPWENDCYDGTLKYRITGGGELVLLVDHKNVTSGFLGERGEEDEVLVRAAANSWDVSLDAIEALVEMVETCSQFRAEDGISVADLFCARAIERLRAWLEAK